MNEQEREEILEGAQEIIDFLKQHQTIPLPYALSDFQIYGMTKEQVIACVKIFGTCKKNFSDSLFYATKRFRNNAGLTINASRGEVCERIVVGTEEVPEKVIPERIEPAHTREIVEWKCSPILAEVEAIAEKETETS